MQVQGLPAVELVEKGMRDLHEGAETIESLLVSLAAALRTLGLAVQTPLIDLELRLYRVLTVDCGDAAHWRYNALVPRIVSFRRAGARAR